MNEWHLVCSLEGFEHLRAELDDQTDDHVRWSNAEPPTDLPCLAFSQAVYAGGVYDGCFVFCYREQAAHLVGGLVLPPGNAPG